MQRAVTTAGAGVSAANDHDVVVCHELQAAYADACEPALWLRDPVRYRPPYTRVVPTALIRRRDG